MAGPGRAGAKAGAVLTQGSDHRDPERDREATGDRTRDGLATPQLPKRPAPARPVERVRRRTGGCPDPRPVPGAPVPEDLLVAEESLVDTVALTPSGGLMPDPFAEGGKPRRWSDPGDEPDACRRHGTARAPSFVSGIFQAGPLAVGGLVANGLNIVATVLIARLLTPRQYGGVAQLLGLFFVLSMPGSALLVGVVRRIAAGTAQGRQDQVHRWTTRLARRCLVGLAVWVVFSVAIEEPLASALRLPSSGGVAAVLIAGGVWLLLCIDRAVLQGHRRYSGLGLNLIVEIGIRTVFVLSFAAAGFGIAGYGIGLLLGEIVATVHARLLSGRAWNYPAAPSLAPDLVAKDRTLTIDLSVAFVGFVLLGILQNADIILVGRLDPSSAGPYAAISVASKSLVFGAILLGSYVLPEAALRWHQGQHALRQLAVTLLFLLVPSRCSWPWPWWHRNSS